MYRGIFLTVLSLLTIFEQNSVDCTSAHNLHNLLRHPHYAEGHQHSPQHHSQHTTSHPHRHSNGSGAPSVPYYSTSSTSRMRHPSEAPTLPTGTWGRVGSKDYYRMSGYSIKTTSAAKSTPIVDPRIPQELSDVREANDHFVRMRSGAYCHWPRPQVICVRDMYPDKEFLPRCTILHRCTETAGCCEDDGLQCGPKAMQEVALHFYVVGSDNFSSDVEKLLFVNHTECECKPKPVTTTSTTPSTTTTKSTISQSPTMSNHLAQRDQQNPKCRSCPAPFCVRELEDGRCSCDCFDRHKPCIRIKKGREALTDTERRCVLSGKCNIPDCEYGAYDPDSGRCPKRPDHLGPKEGDGFRRPIPNHKNPKHRWIYFERD